MSNQDIQKSIGRAALSATQPAHGAQDEPVLSYFKDEDCVKFGCTKKLPRTGNSWGRLYVSATQAAQGEPTDQWPKLNKPATVGAGTFGVGVSARLVVEAAQRRHELNQEQSKLTPEQAREQELNRRKAWDMLNGPAQPAVAQGAGEVVPEVPNLLAEARGAAYDEEGHIMDPDLASAVENIDAMLTSYPTPPAQLTQVVQPVSKDVIRDVFLRNGFTIKDGCSDLKPYVYAAANALLEVAAAQPVQGVPEVPQQWFNLLAEARGAAYDEEGHIMDPDLASAVENIDAMLTSYPTPPAQLTQVVQPVSRDVIRDVFLRNGFTIKPGCGDLKPYVYEAANALLEVAAIAASGRQE